MPDQHLSGSTAPANQKCAPLRQENKQPPWQTSRFAIEEDDPLSGFANIMDVMLVFALGLMLALVTQSQELQRHFKLDPKTIIETGSELIDAPEIIEQITEGKQHGMESLGQVYRDPKTGKLLLIETKHQP
ncbi:hypothetical protein TDB9533_00886 [Thalassocella blandensis]|nr:hypothetical protein TDB9533_00886 [Thalassocella blandensis]